MKILVINSGSSSIKSSLFELAKNSKKEPLEIMSSLIDGIGLDHCRFTMKTAGKNIGQNQKIDQHADGIKLILETLQKTGIIKNLNEIHAVGHRVVHGGEKYSSSVKIDAKVLGTIEKLIPLAPLHNPVNLASIKACKKFLPKSKQVAIFDTAFHSSMPEEAYLYGLPYEMYTKHKIRRYGFHGTSHKYVTQKALAHLKNKKAKIVSCHLGNGSSITASIDGKSIDTSMGFTPLEGVLMGTRSGSIDPAITFHLQENLKMKPKEVDHLLNFDSGLLGISGISSDMREIYQKSLKGDKKAQLAIDMLAYQTAKYCGGYAAACKGLNAIIFTGGLGEKAFYVRAKVIEYLEFLGFTLDKRKNEQTVKSGFGLAEISSAKSKNKVFVIETDEQKQMVIETAKLV